MLLQPLPGEGSAHTCGQGVMEKACAAIPELPRDIRAQEEEVLSFLGDGLEGREHRSMGRELKVRKRGKSCCSVLFLGCCRGEAALVELEVNCVPWDPAGQLVGLK